MEPESTEEKYLQGGCTESECRLCRLAPYARKPGMKHSGLTVEEPEANFHQDFFRVDGAFEQTVDKYHGELWMDKDGTANFKFHIEGGDFPAARNALLSFIQCLQQRLAQEQECPYYVAPEIKAEEPEGLLPERIWAARLDPVRAATVADERYWQAVVFQGATEYVRADIATRATVKEE
jgi:hypothetical protein